MIRDIVELPLPHSYALEHINLKANFKSGNELLKISNQLSSTQIMTLIHSFREFIVSCNLACLKNFKL